MIFSNCILQSYFENNPRDLQVLRHDKPIGVVKKQEHLADVPDYIIPDTLKHIAGISASQKKKRQYPVKEGKSKSIYEAKKNDPLLCAKVDYASKRKRY